MTRDDQNEFNGWWTEHEPDCRLLFERWTPMNQGCVQDSCFGCTCKVGRNPEETL